MSAFGGKADIAIESRMSAYDPKRTFAAAEHFSGLGNISKASAPDWALAFALLPLPAPTFNLGLRHTV